MGNNGVWYWSPDYSVWMTLDEEKVSLSADISIAGQAPSKENRAFLKLLRESGIPAPKSVLP